VTIDAFGNCQDCGRKVNSTGDCICEHYFIIGNTMTGKIKCALCGEDLNFTTHNCPRIYYETNRKKYAAVKEGE